MYYSNQRTEARIVAIAERFEQDEAKRDAHVEMMRIELEALNRMKQDLFDELGQCRSLAQAQNNKQEGKPE